MSAPTPIRFFWSADGSMRPVEWFRQRCEKVFIVGQRYDFVEVQERSMQSHKHFFAAIHEAWLNLPDEYAMKYPTDEILRKDALIMSGFRNERKLALSSPAEARKVAAFMTPRDGEYAIVSVHGRLVIEWTAKSQSVKAMGKEEFQRSKIACLDFVASLVGVSTTQLKAEAGRSA